MIGLRLWPQPTDGEGSFSKIFIVSFISSYVSLYLPIPPFVRMTHYAVYLAVSNRTARQRAHFVVFVPNESMNSRDPGIDTSSVPIKGTVIHVVGEPLMNGFKLEFKRNYDYATSVDSVLLQKLVLLGYVDGTNVTNLTTESYSLDSIPRSTLEQVATYISPPAAGQNIRTPIDGVSSRERHRKAVVEGRRTNRISYTLRLLPDGARSGPRHTSRSQVTGV